MIENINPADYGLAGAVFVVAAVIIRVLWNKLNAEQEKRILDKDADSERYQRVIKKLTKALQRQTGKIEVDIDGS